MMDGCIFFHLSSISRDMELRRHQLTLKKRATWFVQIKGFYVIFDCPALRPGRTLQVVVFLLDVAMRVLETECLYVMGDVRNASVEFLRS